MYYCDSKFEYANSKMLKSSATKLLNHPTDDFGTVYCREIDQGNCEFKVILTTIRAKVLDAMCSGLGDLPMRPGMLIKLKPLDKHSIISIVFILDEAAETWFKDKNAKFLQYLIENELLSVMNYYPNSTSWTMSMIERAYDIYMMKENPKNVCLIKKWILPKDKIIDCDQATELTKIAVIRQFNIHQDRTIEVKFDARLYPENANSIFDYRIASEYLDNNISVTITTNLGRQGFDNFRITPEQIIEFIKLCPNMRQDSNRCYYEHYWGMPPKSIFDLSRIVE